MCRLGSTIPSRYGCRIRYWIIHTFNTWSCLPTVMIYTRTFPSYPKLVATSVIKLVVNRVFSMWIHFLWKIMSEKLFNFYLIFNPESYFLVPGAEASWLTGAAAFSAPKGSRGHWQNTQCQQPLPAGRLKRSCSCSSSVRRMMFGEGIFRPGNIHILHTENSV